MNSVQTNSFHLSIYTQGNPDAKKMALVIPGKLDSKDFAHMHSHVDFLAKKGFFAITFDPPGTWESGWDMTRYTMTNYLSAIDEVIEYFGNKQTLLVGHSRGGKMAIIAGSKNPYITSYVAIMARLAKKEDIKIDEDWKEKGYAATFRSLPPGTGPREKELHLLYSFHEDEMHYFLTDEIMQCSKPKMFIVGKKDSTVIPEKSKGTFDTLSNPKELHEVDSPHDYWHSPAIMEEINKFLGEFIDKYLL